MMPRFPDRQAGGAALATQLADFAGRADVTVLALPRGGVPVAAEVARGLDAPLDVFLARKLGVPDHPERAFGAIAAGGVRVLREDDVRAFELTDADIAAVAAQEQVELERQDQLYRGSRAAPDVADRTVVLVDDGLATGATMSAAVVALRALAPRAIIVAVPVGAREACDQLAHEADALVCALIPDPFEAVGRWYDSFETTTDDEVRALLRDGTAS